MGWRDRGGSARPAVGGQPVTGDGGPGVFEMVEGIIGALGAGWGMFICLAIPVVWVVEILRRARGHPPSDW